MTAFLSSRVTALWRQWPADVTAYAVFPHMTGWESSAYAIFHTLAPPIPRFQRPSKPACSWPLKCVMLTSIGPGNGRGNAGFFAVFAFGQRNHLVRSFQPVCNDHRCMGHTDGVVSVQKAVCRWSTALNATRCTRCWCLSKTAGPPYS